VAFFFAPQRSMRRSAVSLVVTTHTGGHHVCRQYAGNCLAPTFAARLDDADFVGTADTGCSISVATATDRHDCASPVAATLATCVFGATAGAAAPTPSHLQSTAISPGKILGNVLLAPRRIPIAVQNVVDDAAPPQLVQAARMFRAAPAPAIPMKFSTRLAPERNQHYLLHRPQLTGYDYRV
jgi:hypothetical protein